MQWGGDGTRWDFMCLEKHGRDDGGNQLRSMIRTFDQEQQLCPQSISPLNPCTAGEMTVLGQTVPVLLDSNGMTWAKVSTLLSFYSIPFVWDAEKRRILIGSSNIIPRYVENKVMAKPGLPTFELSFTAWAPRDGNPRETTEREVNRWPRHHPKIAVLIAFNLTSKIDGEFTT